MTDGWVIRSVTGPDVSATEELLENAGLPFEGLEPGDEFVVAEIDSRIVGAAGVELHRPFGLLRSVVVSEKMRHTGLGRALVYDRLRWAATNELEALYLLTTDSADFFTNFGFRIVRRDDVPPQIRESRQFVSLCPDSATAMAKELKTRS